MKLVALGDTHGTPYWKDIVSVEKPDVVVFIGDYFDGYSSKFDEVSNFQDIIQYKYTASLMYSTFIKLVTFSRYHSK